MNHTSLFSFLVIVAIPLVLQAQPPTSPPTITELKRLAGQANCHAELMLGMRYRNGDGVPRDYEKAIKWYRRAADRGESAGMDNVGFMYLQGWGVPQDDNIAAAYFKAGAAAGDAQALFNLGTCCFSGRGVEQDYSTAIDAWRRAAERKNENAIWRLAVLLAAGEGLPQDTMKAQNLCRPIAEGGHVPAMLLLGELLDNVGEHEAARRWWETAASLGNDQAEALLELAIWRRQDLHAGSRAYIQVPHLFQGWNNCGATSIAMFARHAGTDVTPYDVKRLCPQSPIGTGTDWQELVTAGAQLGHRWQLLTFTNDESGLSEGVTVIRKHLDDKRPLVIDFTVEVQEHGQVQHYGHTLIVVGYNAEKDQFVLKNPNQPSPGIQILSTEGLGKNWYSGWYSRTAEGKVSRPLIVIEKS